MHGIQDHFPEFFQHKDRRVLQVNNVVRIKPGFDDHLTGLWMLVKEVDEDYLTGLVFVAGKDPELTRVPRLFVDTALRALEREARGGSIG